MSRQRSAAKGAVLLAPLGLLVLALHAWGDPLSNGLGRKVSEYQYPEHVHGPFRIHAPRRSLDVDLFASKALERFVEKAVREHGAALGLHAPTVPVNVYLFHPDAEPQRYGLAAAELKEGEGSFDPARRAIVLRIDPDLKEDAATAALRDGAGRLLLHDAAPAGMSPWLSEGLQGRLRGVKPVDLYIQGGELPTVRDLLQVNARQARTFYFARAAELLAAFLEERMPEEFAYYYRAEQRSGPATLAAFKERFGEPGSLDDRWKEWMRSLK